MPLLSTFGAASSKSFAYYSSISIPTPLFKISPISSLSGLSDGTTVSTITNLGSGGSSYNGTASSNIPTKSTYNGYTVLNFNTTNMFSYTLGSALDASTNASLFFVGQVNTNPRLIALGGYGSTYRNCFFGWSVSTPVYFLFRNTTDSGITANVSGMPVTLGTVGLIKTGTTANVYYNSSSSYTTYTGLSGTYQFQKIGSRDYNGVTDGQKSTGALGDVWFYNTALTATQAQKVMVYLKNLYGT